MNSMEVPESALVTVVGQQAEAQPKRSQAASLLAWSLWALYLVLAGLSLLFESVNAPSDFVLNILSVLVLLAYATVGALIASRHPDNPIGWIFIVAALTILLSVFAVDYALYALVTRPGSLPSGEAMAWIALWTRDLGFLIMFTCLLLFFPDGRLPSQRWRFVAWAAAIIIGLSTLWAAVRPGPIPFAPPLTNPLGIERFPDIVLLLGDILFVCVFALVIACAVSVIVRFRRARGDERQQLKWFTYAAVLPTILLIASQFEDLLQNPVQVFVYEVLFRLSVAMIPFAAAIAIFKYRLYDIDIIINRTLVYVPLTVILAALYAGLDLLLQILFVSITGGKSDAAIVLTTLIIASVFTPVKSNLQERVDKVFKEAPDSARKLRALRSEIESRIYTIDEQQLTNRLLEDAVQTFGARSGALYLKRGDDLLLVRSKGDWQVGNERISISLAHDGEQLGILQLGERPNGVSYTERDRTMLQEAADLVAATIAQSHRD